MTAFPTFPSGHVVSADEMQALLPLPVRKSANQSVTSSTTLVNDNELFLSVVANATYEMWMYLVYDADTVGQLKIGFTGPSGFLLDWTTGGESSTTSGTSGVPYWGYAFAGSTINYGAAGGGTLMVARPSGILTTASTAGTFQLQWAQAASSATSTTVHVTSTMVLRRIK